jgi:hypothetical protein
MKNFFISYSSQDHAFAERLAGALTRKGLHPTFSNHGIANGSDWQFSLRDQIQGTDLFIMVMPEEAAPSGNSAFFEAGVASALGKQIAIVVPDLHKVDRSNIPLDLARVVFTDAADQPIDEVASRIMGAAELVS